MLRNGPSLLPLSLEAGDAASGVTGSHAGSGSLHMPSHNNKQKREETAENNCVYPRSLKMLYKPSGTSAEGDVFGFKRDSTLNAQVCPDVFLPPKWCYVTQNTICCVHSSICQKLNWRENCCNTVNSCHRSKQQTRRDAGFYATSELTRAQIETVALIVFLKITCLYRGISL